MIATLLWSLSMFAISLFFIEYFRVFQKVSASFNTPQRLWNTFVELQAKSLFLIRNRSSNKISISEFSLLFFVLFSCFAACYWTASGKTISLVNLDSLYLIFPCALLTMGTFFLEVRSENQKRRIKLHQLSRKILFFGVAVTTINNFKVSHPLLDTLFDTLLLVCNISFFWHGVETSGYKSLYIDFVKSFIKLSLFFVLIIVYKTVGNIQILEWNYIAIFILLIFSAILSQKMDDLSFSSFKIASTNREKIYLKLISILCAGKVCLVLLSY